jgi:stage II sporulation protein AA (anti-sigma F factor antagonist)
LQPLSHPRPLFHVERRDGDDEVLLLLHGELDISSSGRFARELLEAERGEPALLVLDAADLAFMDVAGLRVILEAARRARKRGSHLSVINPSPPIRRLFELTGIDHTADVVTDPEPRSGPADPGTGKA